ncbi:putative colanic acid polymerase WcaD [Curtobacterium sp. ISL-83]|uniref:putative colanic acid polymerase WcaD n=1 Tax=Curtobacterium sp. ISL-83 TaxID=2819145 RepID=UPI001BEB39A9|nr:putative colanic acid polymerase WcaD [Curtobacterium sp. ISL-83]MBT2502711.1 putative colanic acid polymerase WcaD [Curtobacterium sp. ISL-83]
MSQALYRALVTILTVGLVVFQHFQIGEFGNYPVTIGVFIGLALLCVASTRVAVPRLILTFAIVCVPNALVQIVAPSIRDGYGSFFGTFGLFVLGSFFVAQFSQSTVRPAFVPAAIRGMFLALIVVTLLSVIQVLTGSRGSLAWFNLFGQHQYLYQYDPHLEFNPIPRAAAFYLEPSYAAFVIGTLAVGLVVVKRHAVAAWILGSVGLLAVRSATGLLVFAAVAAVALIVSRSRWRLPAVAGLLLTGIVAVPYLAGRLDSTFTAGSSAYYRLVGPLRILSDTLVHFPFGHPFGSLRNTVADYGILNGASTGDSLDNGFYVLVFYFGWIGVIGCLGLLAWVGRRVVVAHRASQPGRALVAVWAVGSLFFSGGVMLPEYLLMLWLLFAVHRVPHATQPLGIETPRNDHALDRHNHLQRR